MFNSNLPFNVLSHSSLYLSGCSEYGSVSPKCIFILYQRTQSAAAGYQKHAPRVRGQDARAGSTMAAQGQPCCGSEGKPAGPGKGCGWATQHLLECAGGSGFRGHRRLMHRSSEPVSPRGFPGHAHCVCAQKLQPMAPGQGPGTTSGSAGAGVSRGSASEGVFS